MKRVKCCTACRRRHRKCVTQPGASQCGTCLESGLECRFENDIRFKRTHSEAQKDPGRKWAKVPQKISFTTPRGIDGKVPEEADTRPETDEAATQPISEGMMEISIDDSMQSQPEDWSLEEVFNYWDSPSNIITDSSIDHNMTPAS
ncbi:transcription regulatory SNF2 [Fusarium sp. NRRL 52700]|nr:transcription regulatory SNF2 [Fusarium sp. NRRL 52700]